MKIDKIHPTTIQEKTPSEILGTELFALRYDLLLEVVRGMKKEAERQAEGDRKRGRTKLAQELEKSASTLGKLEEEVGRLVYICAPYIKAEKDLEL
jgi:hypothetical protein